MTNFEYCISKKMDAVISKNYFFDTVCHKNKCDTCKYQSLIGPDEHVCFTDWLFEEHLTKTHDKRVVRLKFWNKEV